MSIEVLKEKINIELEKFKTYVLVTVVLGGGVSGLLLKLNESSDFIFKAVLVIGFLFFIFFSFSSFYSYIQIGKLSKKLEKID